ncbi:MAG: hypothetical protein KGI98_17740, partial [Euryarchaeota archaeon]|nr:hypothetical protein [Euryarchaeota archaeon]
MQGVQADRPHSGARSILAHARRWPCFPVLLVLVFSAFVAASPAARADNPHTCGGTGNITGLWCGGDFTTTSWSSSWATLVTNQQACYSANSNSYSDSASGGSFYGKASTRADESSSCATNVGIVEINIGTHGGSFTAWKAGSAYYTVVANFTFSDFLSIGTYCASTGSPYTSAQIQSS